MESRGVVGNLSFFPFFSYFFLFFPIFFFDQPTIHTAGGPGPTDEVDEGLCCGRPINLTPPGSRALTHHLSLIAPHVTHVVPQGLYSSSSAYSSHSHLVCNRRGADLCRRRLLVSWLGNVGRQARRALTPCTCHALHCHVGLMHSSCTATGAGKCAVVVASQIAASALQLMMKSLLGEPLLGELAS